MNRSIRYSQILKSLIITTIIFVLTIGAGLTAYFSTTAPVWAASSKRNLGILGKEAPELNLTGWIDGNGQPMEPVVLNDLRGKVVYLYFFQDW